MLFIVENLPEHSTIAVPDFQYDGDNLSHNRIYYLLFEFPLVYYNYSEFGGYAEFRAFLTDNEASHALLRRDNHDVEFLEELDQQSELTKIFQECEGSAWYGVYLVEI